MAPFVKELEKHPKYCNLYLKIIVLKHPKLEMEDHPKGLKKEHISSTHYIVGDTVSDFGLPWD